MGRKKRKGMEVKPFCYYCDREFEDEKVLLLHQKAKHFKCSQCNRKLDTATGLVVHLLQVHKEAINAVPNSRKDREGTEVVVHGMSGIPPEIMAEKQRALVESRGKEKQAKSAHTVFGSGMFNPMGGHMDPNQPGGFDFMAFRNLAASIPGQNESILGAMLGGQMAPPGMMNPSLMNQPPQMMSQMNPGALCGLEHLFQPHMTPDQQAAMMGSDMGLSGMPPQFGMPNMMPGISPHNMMGMPPGFNFGQPEFSYHNIPAAPSMESIPPVINAPAVNKVVAERPPNGYLVYDDDTVSMEEKRATVIKYSYRPPLVITPAVAA